MNDRVYIYDTTLRDGTQREGISLSLSDKLRIASWLDDIGIHYIEGGWPGSNPKDAEFFKAVRDMTFKQAKITAFGSTRRKNIEPEADLNIRAIIEAETPAEIAVSIVAEMIAVRHGQALSGNRLGL